MNTEENARDRAIENYLNVKYSAARRPYTSYPKRLCTYLSATYLTGRGFRTLLDIGSGRGEFLHGFAECGFEGQGLDGSKSKETSFPEPVLKADIEGKPIPLPDESFDVIFSKSVIEHIHNTDVFVADHYRLLKPGGIMICMTPDWRACYRNFYDDSTHVRPFTLPGLKDTVLTHGFEILDARRFRQLPFVWKYPIMHLLCTIIAFLPDNLKRFKIVKFSKEWMLLVVAIKPKL